MPPKEDTEMTSHTSSLPTHEITYHLILSYITDFTAESTPPKLRPRSVPHAVEASMILAKIQTQPTELSGIIVALKLHNCDYNSVFTLIHISQALVLDLSHCDSTGEIPAACSRSMMYFILSSI